MRVPYSPGTLERHWPEKTALGRTPSLPSGDHEQVWDIFHELANKIRDFWQNRQTTQDRSTANDFSGSAGSPGPDQGRQPAGRQPPVGRKLREGGEKRKENVER